MQIDSSIFIQLWPHMKISYFTNISFLSHCADVLELTITVYTVSFVTLIAKTFPWSFGVIASGIIVTIVFIGYAFIYICTRKKRPVKHLRWSVFPKQLTTFSRQIFLQNVHLRCLTSFWTCLWSVLILRTHAVAVAQVGVP